MFSRQNLFFTCIALRWLNSCLFLENSGSFFKFNEPHKCSGILKCFSLQKGVFSFRINEWTRSWISLYCSPSAICVRRGLERDRLVSIRWLENLDHMALARGKWKRKMKPLCEKVTVCDPRGVDSAYERGGDCMLDVWLRGVNFGFWSHLGCSWQNAIVLFTLFI